jgi:hypothetical protein
LVEILENTHVPTLALGNISLTLPPATLRKAAPQNPVAKRKIRKTSVKAKWLGQLSVRSRKEKFRVARTNVGSESDREAEYEK